MAETKTDETVSVRVPSRYKPMVRAIVMILALYGFVLFMKKVVFKV